MTEKQMASEIVKLQREVHQLRHEQWRQQVLLQDVVARYALLDARLQRFEKIYNTIRPWVWAMEGYDI